MKTRRQGRLAKECIQTYMTEPGDADNAVWRKKNKPFKFGEGIFSPDKASRKIGEGVYPNIHD